MVLSNRWRVRFLTNGGDSRVGAGGIDFRNTAGGPILSTGGTPSASSTSGFGGPVSNLFDSNPATEWLANSVNGEWAEYATPTDVEINHITVTTVGSTPYYTTLGPRSFEVQAFVGNAWVTQWLSGDIFYDAPNAVRTVTNPNATLPPIEASFPIAWAVEAPLPAISASFPTSWKILEQIGRSFATAWAIEAYPQIAASFPTAWAIAEQPGRISASFPVAWAIDVAPAQIARSFGIAWRIEQSLADVNRMIVPDYPITEIWTYQTSVFRSESGKEQRRARVMRPVITQQFTAPSFDPIDFWNTRRVMEIDTDSFYPIPMFQYYAYLTAPALVGDTRVYFDPARANVVIGQYVALMADNDETVLTKVETIHEDGVTLALPLMFDLDMNYFACAVLLSRISDDGETTHSPVHAYTTYGFVSAERELDFVRPGNTEVLPMLGNIPLVDKFIRANDEVRETYITGNVTVDNERGNPVMFMNEPTRRSFEMVYLANRETSPSHLDFWRRFFDTVRGSQKAFAVPTFRPDAYPSADVQAGDTSVTLLGRDFYDVFSRGGYVGLAFGWQTLAMECARVVSVALVAGNSAVELAEPIVGTGYSVASFIMLMRATDQIVLTHDDVKTVVSFGVQMVQE